MDARPVARDFGRAGPPGQPSGDRIEHGNDYGARTAEAKRRHRNAVLRQSRPQLLNKKMKAVKFLVVTILVWFPVVMGLSIAADAVRIPDTDTWMWVLRGAGAVMAVCAGWVVSGATRATRIVETVLPVISLVTNFMYLACFLLGAVAVVMIFVKDASWLYQRLYHPFVLPTVALSFFSLVPITLLLMIFRKTRALGGICLYLLSIFFGFSLWFYSLMVAGSHGPGWVIGGVLLAGLGVILTAAIASAVWGQWAVVGEILVVAVVIWGARMLGLFIAGRQIEKDEDEERSKGLPDDSARPAVAPYQRRE